MTVYDYKQQCINNLHCKGNLLYGENNY